MQRFTLIHDGSTQGWRTAYLAFHVAVRLGASLQVLLADSATDRETLSQRTTQVKIGGRAARLAIETLIVADYLPDTIVANTAAMNGLFIPRHLVPETEIAVQLLEALSCPLWIVSEESEIRKMAVLVDNMAEDGDLTASAAALSQRMGETLTGLILSDGPPATIQSDANLAWMPLSDFSLPLINSALGQLHANLLFIRPSKFSLVAGLSCTCVVCPAVRNA